MPLPQRGDVLAVLDAACHEGNVGSGVSAELAKFVPVHG